jgi:hypothetical protein
MIAILKEGGLAIRYARPGSDLAAGLQQLIVIIDDAAARML